VKINSLSITGFRNLTGLTLNPAESVNVFYGSNGSGKTNLLEAIFTLCLGRSQRGAADVVMVGHSCDVYRLEGQLEIPNRSYGVAVAYQRGGRKKTTIDQAPAKLRDLYDHFSAVSLGPEDSEILAGSPSARRNFLDIYLSQLSGKYLSDLSDYHRAVAQKNAALKQQMDATAFDSVLITHGARIMHGRAEFIGVLQDAAVEYYNKISGGERFTILYKPSVSIDDEHQTIEDIETAFHVRLEDMFERERILQTAIVGPHRDDIMFEIGGYPARTHGSQGQLRTAAVALKLAVYNLLKEKRKMSPLLLLDEIFAELDDDRSGNLIDAFDDFSQLFLTTATAPPPKLAEVARNFRIADGGIEEIS
jgi:DNA replication and repair protein RecF